MRGPELVGELVRVRPLAERDAERTWELVQDPEALRLTGTTTLFTRDQVDEWARTISDQPGRYDFAITSAVQREGVYVTDEMIGEIVLTDVDDETRSAKLRLSMLPNYRGRGYGGDAIQSVLDWAFDPAELGLHRVSLEVLSINPRARMLYESQGFRHEGVLRDAARDGDGFCDVFVLSILDHEHEPRPEAEGDDATDDGAAELRDRHS